MRTFLSAAFSAHIMRGPDFGIDFQDLAGSKGFPGVAIRLHSSASILPLAIKRFQ
jgi:hypothetical protein